MARPRSPEPVVVMSLRMPASMVRMIDERMSKLKSSAPGVSLTRADVVRNLLIQAMRMGDDPAIRLLTTPPPPDARVRYTEAEMWRFAEEDEAAAKAPRRRGGRK